MITLQLVSRSDSRYQAIRERHYVDNHGTIGRQLHYLVRLDEQIVGIITGASAVWAVKPRDEYFSITALNREEVVGRYLINNTVFRLEVQQPNLGTQVLALWRRQVVHDWQVHYGDLVLGFETFVFGENRTGALYKADNWTYVGETKGNTKFHANGTYGGTERLETEKKLIFVKRAPKQKRIEYKLSDLPLFSAGGRRMSAYLPKCGESRYTRFIRILPPIKANAPAETEAARGGYHERHISRDY